MGRLLSPSGCNASRAESGNIGGEHAGKNEVSYRLLKSQNNKKKTEKRDNPHRRRNIQDHLTERTIALSIKSGKLTASILARAMRATLRKIREPPKEGCGKMSLRQLSRQRASLSNIEITEGNIALFRRFARRYNVDFALKRDDSENPPRWLVFFKARDTDALTAAFKEFSRTVLGREEKTKGAAEKVKAKTAERKPSVHDKIQRFKSMIKPREGLSKVHERSRARGEKWL